MKFDNLFQDPASDSEAPYADTLIIDAGGMDVKYGGDTVAHVSFEDLDPFEIAFHAIPGDWEPHKEFDSEKGEFLPVTSVEILENTIFSALLVLGEKRGWERS